jgi:hypothetical protein
MDNAEVHEFWSLLVISIAWKFCSCENIVELVEWFEELAEIRRVYKRWEGGLMVSLRVHFDDFFVGFLPACLPACLSAAVFLWRSSW